MRVQPVTQRSLPLRSPYQIGHFTKVFGKYRVQTRLAAGIADLYLVREQQARNGNKFLGELDVAPEQLPQRF